MEIFYCLLTINFLLLASSKQMRNVTAFYITPPASNRDWKQISSLVVQTFDAPNKNKDANNDFDNNKLWWDLVDKRLTEQFTYSAFVKNARKLKGKKYAIFVAKSSEMGENDILGMVELGMALMDKSITEVGNQRKAYATIGVLCVQNEYQHAGVGSALVTRCEQAVNSIWNESEVYVQVEPHNVAALDFFQNKCGYCNTNETKNVTVTRRRMFEERPHIILKKTFNTIPPDT